MGGNEWLARNSASNVLLLALQMYRDGYDMMVTKYSADAENEIAEKQRKVEEHNQRAALFARRVQLAKTGLLMVALLGIGAGLYFARDLGGVAATMASHEPDPSLSAPILPSKAKVQRKLAEIRKKQIADLDEIEGGDSQDNGEQYQLPEEVKGKGKLSEARKKQIAALDDIEGGDSQDNK
jgi:hypothetical protein